MIKMIKLFKLPLITSFQWGKLEIVSKDGIQQFGNNNERADVIITSDGNKYNIKKWNWKSNESKVNSHSPGISYQAIENLIKSGCEVVIISKGFGNPTFTMDGVLECQVDVLTKLKKKFPKVKFYHLKSEKAILKWNKLMTTNLNETNNQNEKIGMLLHMTC